MEWWIEDEPVAYKGKKYAAEHVAEAIVELVEKRQHEIIVPKRNLALWVALFLRSWFPSVLRRGMARMTLRSGSPTSGRRIFHSRSTRTGSSRRKRRGLRGWRYCSSKARTSARMGRRTRR